MSLKSDRARSKAKLARHKVWKRQLHATIPLLMEPHIRCCFYASMSGIVTAKIAYDSHEAAALAMRPLGKQLHSYYCWRGHVHIGHFTAPTLLRLNK